MIMMGDQLYSEKLLKYLDRWGIINIAKQIKIPNEEEEELKRSPESKQKQKR